MDTEIKTMMINGMEYVQKGSESHKPAENLNGMPFVIVRTFSAGVFAGFLEARKDQEVILRKARRIWSWAGAASLSQLAVDGTSKPDECKFPVAVDKIELMETIEILYVTDKGKKSIDGVKVWEVK